MAFRVGQKVECINATGSYCLRSGEIYICGGVDSDFLRVDCCQHHRLNAHWFKWRFRSLSRETDISALKALLVPGAKIKETT